MSNSLEARLRQQAAEISALYETTHDLVIERDLSKLLHTIVERAVGLLHASGGGLYLCEPELRQVRCVVSYHTAQDFTGVVLKYGEGAAGRVAETGEPLLIEDYRVWHGRASAYESDQPFAAVLSAPMHWRGQVIGVIHVLESTQAGVFTHDDLRNLTLFADHAAIAIENSRLLDFEQRRLQEAAAIAEVGRDISASLQLDIVLERISTHAKNLLRAETSAVYLSDPAQPTLRAIAATGLDAVEIKQDPLVIGEGILGDIALHKTGEIVNTIARDPRAITVKGTEVITHEHILGVPVLSREQMTGLIAVWRSGEGNGFKEADLDFLASLAQYAAIAIENARLFESTRRRLKELETLQSIASALRIAQSLDEVFPIILDQLIELLDFGSASVDLIDLGRGKITTLLARGVWAPMTGLSTPLDAGGSGRVIATGKPYITSNVIADGIIAFPGLVGQLNNAACVPIVVQQQPIGTLWVGRDSPAAITEEEVNLLLALGEMVGNTIHRMKLYEQTERLLNDLQVLNADLEQRVLDRTAQLEAAYKELDAFSYSVSHDLRAPLRFIDGYARLLEADYASQMPSEAQHFITNIRESTLRMGRLIEDMLLLARVTRQELRREAVDLSYLAQVILSELQNSAPQRLAEFVIEAGLTAEGDPGLLHVAMANLLNNAWKYTARRAPARIEFCSLPQENGKKAFFLRDNGIGFDMALSNRLFGPFQRLHAESEFEGLGIGLATVQRIVHRHGGRIWAEGEVDKGATFYFTLG